MSWGCLGPREDGFAGPWAALGRSLGSLPELWGLLEALKDRLPVGPLDVCIIIGIFMVTGSPMLGKGAICGGLPPVPLPPSAFNQS